MGTKGQYLKMLPVLKELDRRNIVYNLIHTGQHFLYTKKISEIYGLKNPDVFLTTKKEDLKNLKDMFIWLVRSLLAAFRLKFKKGDVIVIHGDTESTLLGVIIAKIKCCKLAHVESGLRSYNYLNPFPEEIIRIISTLFSEFLFCPTVKNEVYLRQYYRHKKIICTYGNTIFDTLALTVTSNGHKNYRTPSFKYAVASIHRKETLYKKKKLVKVVEILNSVSRELKLLLVLHKNTAYALKKYRLLPLLKGNKNIIIFYDFVDYPEFMKLIKESEFVITDGGGLQEETYYLNKPCLLLRQKTERDYGLSETACLSKFNTEIIKEFIGNYKKFTRRKIDNSFISTQTIVDYFEKFFAE